MNLSLPLEPTDDRANPAFRDAASCVAWINQLQLTNLHQAHSVLRAQMDEFNRFPMRGLERLQVLESLRETIAAVQTDYARKLVLKKLPLAVDELAVFAAIVALWQAMLNGYQRCLQSYLSGDRSLSGQLALLCQRCLTYTGQQILEHLRRAYEFDPALWRRLHELYAYAADQGCANERVPDEPVPLSCEAVYLRVLLICHARPVELTRSQLLLLERWLAQWQDALQLEPRCTVSKGDAPPLGVDLAGDQGLQPLAQLASVPTVRFLPMVPLSKLLRVKTLLLQQGQSPQQLELGGECSSSDCVEFLQRLHRLWCEPASERAAPRHPVARAAVLCFGLEACYAHLAGRPFRKSAKEVGADSIARKQIAAFGRVLSDTNRFDLAKLGFALESWEIENESALGARVQREAQSGCRVSPQQLLALRPDDASQFILARVSWCLVTRSGHLRLGLKYLLGVPQAVTVKGKGINPALSEKAVPAMLLPEWPALKVPASLVLPRDFFQPERLVELARQDGTLQTVKLGVSVEKGVDFERVSFRPVVS